MTENNENNLDTEHKKTESCNTCPYQDSYFIEKDENDDINAKCMSAYFGIMTDIRNMKNNFSPEQIYLIVPRFERKKDNFALPQFVINTYDGIKNHYQAEIKKSLYNKLLLILAKCTLSHTLLPLAIAIRKKTMALFVMNREQYEMIWELFLQDKTYKLERIDVPEGTLVTDDNILMSDLLQNDQPTFTSEN